MQITIDRQPKAQTKLTIELSPEEMQPYLEKGAKDLSIKHKIEGFRPGMASLGIVIQKLGAQAVWEEAAEHAVRKSFVEAMTKEQVQSVGRPHIHIQKLAPNNPFIYTAEVAVLPDATVGDYTSFKTKREVVTVDPAKVTKAMEELRSMFATEAMVEREAKNGDKVEVDFDLTVDMVPVENGSGKNHPVMLGSNNFIPGFEENLVGMKKGETKKFSVTFPAQYHHQPMAGKEGNFTATVKNIFEITKPELNDAFAKQAGKFESVAELQTQVAKNIQQEMEQEKDMAFERALIEELIGRSTFGDIPELLINGELEKMIGELKEEVTRQGGIEFDDYLKNIKKSVDDLKQEFRPQAEHRVKSALVIRQVAVKEQITADPAMVEEEVQSTLKMYAQTPDILERIDSDDYRDYVRNLQVNRKVVELLKQRATKG